MKHLRRPLAALLLLACPLGAAAQAPDWSPAGPFAETMSLFATLSFEGAPAGAGDLLAAFVGDEPRGVVEAADYGGTYLFVLTVGSDDGRAEPLRFKGYDASEDRAYDLCERITFRPDDFRGAPPGDPVSFATAGTSTPCALNWQAPTGFPQSMFVYVGLLFGGVRSSDGADRVAAFAGGELRGVGAQTTTQPEVWVMEVWGLAAGEVLTFQTYDASERLTYAPGATISFIPDGTHGEAGSPLMLVGSTAVPVELAAFAAVADDGDAVLRWATASETDNAGFEVQHARRDPATPTAPGGWETLAFVPGHGTTTQPRRYVHRLPGLAPGRHAFRLKQVDFDGGWAFSPTVELTLEAPRALVLLPSAPNPSGGRTRIGFTVPADAPAVLTVYDVLGREVAVLFDGVATAGPRHEVTFDARGLGPGLYVYALEHGGRRAARTLVVTD